MGWVGLCGLIGVMLCVVLAGIDGQSSWMFQQGDGRPFYGPDVGRRSVTMMWGAWSDTGLGVGYGGYALHPLRMLTTFMPPLVFHVARYVLDVLLMGLGAYWFLIGRRVRPRAALLAGVFLAFSDRKSTRLNSSHYS